MDGMGTFEQEQRKKQVERQFNQDSLQVEQQQSFSLNVQQEQQKNQVEEGQNALPAYEQVQVNDRALRVKEALEGRTISAILTQDVSDSDSTEMAAVKEKVTACNSLLARELSLTDDAKSIEEQIKAVEVKYLDAIAACQYYCDNKNPLFATGKMRKKAVSDTLDLLKKEMLLLPKLHEMAVPENASMYGDKVKLINLIAEAGIAQEDAQAADEQQAEAKKQEAHKDPIESLTYEDFAKMLTTDDSDNLEFRGQSLRIVKNGIMSKPSEITTESNKKMVEHFIATAIQQIEKRQELSEVQKSNMRMRLQYQLGVKLLDTQAGAVPISRLREAMGMVDHLYSDVERALQSEKHLSPIQHRLAMAVDESLPIPEEKEEVKQKLVIEKLRSAIKEAEAAGIEMPEITDEELQNTVAGRIYTIRDEVFHNIQRVYQSMSSLNGGRVADFNALARDKKAINIMLAMSVSRAAAVTPGWAQAADYQLRSYMTHVAFAHCGDESLENEFMKTRIFELAGGGDTGLSSQVMEQLARNKSWTNKSENVHNGMHNLGQVCVLLGKFGDMQSKAFCEGLTEEEAKQLKGIGNQLYNIVHNENIVKDMRLVAENLKGSRFAKGFAKMGELIGNPELFTKSADNIAAATVIKEKREDVRKESELARLQREASEKLNLVNKLERIKLSEADKQLSGLDSGAKSIASVLLQVKKPSELIKKGGDDNAKSIAALYFAIHSMNLGDTMAEVSVGGVGITLTQRESGDVELRIGNKRVIMPYSTQFLESSLQKDISENLDKYGDEIAGNVFSETFAQTKQRILEQSDDINDTSRTVLINILKHKTGLDAPFFTNTAVDTLSMMAEYAINGMMDRQDVEEYINSLNNSNQTMLNEKETLEMIRVLEKQQKEKLAKPTVIFSEQKKEEKKEDEKPRIEWAPEEAELMELISDMVFSKDTWKTDLEQREPADRLRVLLYEHSELLSKIIMEEKNADNETIIDSTFKKLKLPGVDGMAETIKQQFEQLSGQNMAMRVLRGNLDRNQMAAIIRAVLGDKQDMENAQPAIEVLTEKLNALNKNLNKAKKGISKAANKFLSLFGVEQKEEEEKEEEEKIDVVGMILEQKKNMLKTLDTMDDELNEQTKNQVEGIQEQVNDAVKTIFDSNGSQKVIDILTLQQIMDRNVKGQEGQGLFYKNVLTNYFKAADIMDQRAMIASALRNVKPTQLGDDGQPGEKEKTEQMGEFLGGFLKGAGPLLHKTLQGLPLEGMPDSLKLAIGDMKSKLAPISHEIVEARMNKIVMNSKGLISHIEVKKSLGAASVGQTFFCKIYGPNMEKNGQDVVIKLLRPDVKNHLEREKKFMLDCAEKVSPGMLKTFQGQLGAIENELDLRVEAQNVELGKVYDKGPKTVRSMKVVDFVSPDSNTLMLEKAPGTTVDKYIEDAKAEYQEIMAEYQRTRSYDGGYVALEKLHKLRDGMLKRQGYVADLAKKWVVSGIYEEGFYHGDLHAGNIMVDDNCATVIDFGNATKIAKDKQDDILHLVCATQTQSVDGFKEHFRNLLSEESKSFFDANEKKFSEMLNVVLFKEGDAGLRIAVALSEAQKLGLELPASIHNFSQCQIRLNNTINDMIAQINDMAKGMEEIEKYNTEAKEVVDPFALIKQDVQSNIVNRRKFEKKEEKVRPEALDTLVRRRFNEKPPFDTKKYKESIRQEKDPLDMGRVYDLHSVLAILKDVHNMSELVIGAEAELRDRFKDEAMKSLKNFHDRMTNEFQVNSSEFEQLIAKIESWYDKPDKTIEELDGYIAEAYTVHKSDLIDGYTSNLGKVQELKRNGQTKTNEYTQAEDELAKEAEKLFYSSIPSLRDTMCEKLLTNVDTQRKYFETYMRDWFADKENSGEELKSRYDEIISQKNSGVVLDETSEQVKEFMDLFETAMVQRAKNFETMAGRREVETKTFYDVMGEIIKSRTTATAYRLGWSGILNYSFKTNKQQRAEERQQEIQQEIQNAKEVLDQMVSAVENIGLVFMKFSMLTQVDGEKRKEEKERINELLTESLKGNIDDMLLPEQVKNELNGELELYVQSHDNQHIKKLMNQLIDIHRQKEAYLTDDKLKEDMSVKNLQEYLAGMSSDEYMNGEKEWTS